MLECSRFPDSQRSQKIIHKFGKLNLLTFRGPKNNFLVIYVAVAFLQFSLSYYTNKKSSNGSPKQYFAPRLENCVTYSMSVLYIYTYVKKYQPNYKKSFYLSTKVFVFFF